jgi:hypothetical protein
MALRAAADAGAGGSIVTSVTGTANQITASPNTGAVVLSLPANVQVSTSLAIGGATIGTNALAVTGTAMFNNVVAVNGSTSAFLSSNGSNQIQISSSSGSPNSAGAFAAGNLMASGTLTFQTAANGILLKQGANGLCGTLVANGATAVAVSNTNVAITDSIILSLNTAGGTVGVIGPTVVSITANSGFSVKAQALDTSTYNYAIIKNAP